LARARGTRSRIKRLTSCGASVAALSSVLGVRSVDDERDVLSVSSPRTQQSTFVSLCELVEVDHKKKSVVDIFSLGADHGRKTVHKEVAANALSIYAEEA
jgi:hypothetical protein